MSAPGRRERRGPRAWATLDTDALRDEIASNRRTERRVTWAGVAGLVVAVLVLLAVAVLR